MQINSDSSLVISSITRKQIVSLDLSVLSYQQALNKVIELGFVRRLKAQVDGGSARATQEPVFEVRRILKAFVDAQWLADFDQRLAAYLAQLNGPDATGPDDE